MGQIFSNSQDRDRVVSLLMRPQLISEGAVEFKHVAYTGVERVSFRISKSSRGGRFDKSRALM